MADRKFTYHAPLRWTARHFIDSVANRANAVLFLMLQIMLGKAHLMAALAATWGYDDVEMRLAGQKHLTETPLAVLNRTNDTSLE